MLKLKLFGVDLLFWKSLKHLMKDVSLKVEGQTTGILEEKLKLESEVAKLKEKLENAGNQVSRIYLKIARNFSTTLANIANQQFFNFVENCKQTFSTKG